MIMYLLLFANALLLSAIAAYYSIIGLTAIFAAAAIPVAIMGGSLEIAKLVVASWLYRYWNYIPKLMKTYFTFALVILMLITSMGIFGYLSKAHLDQNVPIGDVQAKLTLFDEKIKNERENIDAARKALAQMDAQVNERLSRSSNEQGAERAIQIRRQQQAERTKLQNDIARAQSNIAKLNEERAPVAAEVRKVEAEVGPIKYIAAMIYGDDPDENTLEKAVRWLIIILIFVFDPLAVLMLIAANLTQMKMTGRNAPPTTSGFLKSKEDKEIKEEPNVTKHYEWTEQGPTNNENLHSGEVEPIVTEVVKSEPNLELPKVQETLVEQPVTVEPIVQEEKPKKKRKTNAIADAQEPVIKDTYTEDKNVSMDFNNEVDKMINEGKVDDLETAYKKIVKELGKKNRAKTTHWGPLRSSK